MKILLILLDAVVISGIVLIVWYLILDRARFRVERQYLAVKETFSRWAELCSALPGCETLGREFKKTRNVSKKYRLLARMAKEADGRQTPEMRALAEELEVFCGVYVSLAEPYNRKLMSRFWGKLGQMLGFRPFPLLQLQ